MFDLYRAEDLIYQVETKIKYGLIKNKTKKHMETGIGLILKEREQQLLKNNRTLNGDVENNSLGQLSDAASILCQMIPEGLLGAYVQGNKDLPPTDWNKDLWEKMLSKPYKDRLIIAGALIAAELDRIQRVVEKTALEVLDKELDNSILWQK